MRSLPNTSRQSRRYTPRWLRTLGAVLLFTISMPVVLMLLPGDEPKLHSQKSEPEFRPIRLLKEFPAITDVPILQADEVDEELTDNELVIGVVVNEEARAYPINMLTGPKREIINDTLGGQSIAATW